jgi:hypothetical protein
MKFRKYEFEPTKWEELKSDLEVSHKLDEETFVSYNNDIIVSVVEIGYILLADPVFDDKMNVVTEAVLSDKYSVDIIWQEDELPSFASYKIWCAPVGIHSFGASIDADYEQAYNEQLAK